MATINIRIDEKLKSQSFAELERLGVSPSELMRQTLQYVADNGQLPIKNKVVTAEDEQLLETARQRLNDPQPVKVSLDDL